MIEPRLYRAAFIPAVLAIVLVMFSLESQPKRLPQALAADILFDGVAAAEGARAIAAAEPDRRAGSVGDRRVARTVREGFARNGFAVELQRFDRDGKSLVNVIGRRAGRSRRQVVVIAARDAAPGTGSDPGGSAADTAALIELARVFQGRPSRKTIVLISVDGAALGESGVKEVIEEIGDAEFVDGVVALSGSGAATNAAPVIAGFSNDTTRAGIGLMRTAAESLRQEGVPPAGGASPGGQVARLAFPLGPGVQGRLITAGYDTIRIGGDGELPDTEARRRLEPDRLGALGRAALRTSTAVDQGGGADPGPRTYVTVVSQVMPGWVLAVLALALICPPIVATVDAFARARRRRERVGAWLAWVGAGVLAFVAGLALSHLLALVGATPDPPGAAVDPAIFPLSAGALATLAAVAVTIAGVWAVARPVARRIAGGELTAGGAGAATSIVLCAAALALWLANPFAALLAAPAVNLWMLVVLTDPPPPSRARWLMAALGLALPVLLLLYMCIVLSVDPLSATWYGFMLVTGGQIGIVPSLAGCMLAAVLGSLVAIARAGDPTPPGPAPASVRGPASYAGPGSLGGVDSALRR